MTGRFHIQSLDEKGREQSEHSCRYSGEVQGEDYFAVRGRKTHRFMYTGKMKSDFEEDER